MQKAKGSWKKYIPIIHFYGFDNQFQHYMSNVFKGDFGISYSKNIPVATILARALPITLLLNGLAILLVFAISIPLGRSLATSKSNVFSRLASALLFLFYAMPVFWVGSILIIFLGGGDFLHLFPVSGLLEPENFTASFITKLTDVAWHLVLPVFCLTYTSLAFTTRQVRGAVLHELHHDYVQTARAKGLPEIKVLRHHVFRNALLPLITMLAFVFPALVEGGVIVENTFTIQGMGKESLAAMTSLDYPVVLAMIIIITCMTVLGNITADVLYALADPRISFTKNESHA